MYPGPFWIQHRDTHQYVIVGGSDHTYTACKGDATQYDGYEAAETAFEEARLPTQTHCIIPSRGVG